MTDSPDAVKELIVIRSLADSDLGIFAAHRAAATSKQRAININAPIAKLVLHPRLFEAGDAQLPCIISFMGQHHREERSFKKVHKNWRLGGKKIEGDAYSRLDAKDFMLLRTVSGNDGTFPVVITFIGKKTDQVVHAGIVAILEKKMNMSMATFTEGETGFQSMAKYCPSPQETESAQQQSSGFSFPPMPRQGSGHTPRTPLSMKEKIRQPHILSRMFQVASDLSAPAQHRFMKTVEDLASVLRDILVATNRIIKLEKNHSHLWKKVAGQQIGFVDGGLANLSMLGSAPIAARVGGYTVIPGDSGPERESFTVLKCLIDELYASDTDGTFEDSFPDLGALRDAARISIEAAGAVRLLAEQQNMKWLMLHGSLVSPVSRYTDVIRDGVVRHCFPNFSPRAITELFPPEEHHRTGDACNFINTYLRQLEMMHDAQAVVCGVVERPGVTSTVCKSLLDSLDEHELKPLLPEPPGAWKKEFRKLIDPSEDDEMEGQRITDTLLFRCILEPGEAILPVPVERNLLRKAPNAWKHVICNYPRPWVSYLQASEWSDPVRIEVFKKDVPKFRDTAELIMHCCLLLPRYAFPAGLDIVDKYAKIPNWMSRPINTHTAVRTMKHALDAGDSKLFDTLRRTLCGTGREWLLRPGIYH